MIFSFCFQALMEDKMGFVPLGEKNMTSVSEYKGVNDEK